MADFWAWAGWIVALLLGAVAINANVKFDLNECLKERRKHKEEALRGLCPHVKLFKEGDEYGVKTTYTSPTTIGATSWTCEGCGRVTNDFTTLVETTEYWVDNPDALQDLFKKTMKLKKKWGRG